MTKSPKGSNRWTESSLTLNFQLLSLLRKNQFSGREFEHYNANLIYFLEACNTINQNGVSESYKRLCLFVYYPKGRAKDWLNALSSGTIATWDDLKKAFPAAFSQQQNTSKIERKEIAGFQQEDKKNLYDARER